MAEVVLATCADYPHGDEDAALLTAALSAGGVPARWQVWDDPAASWSGALTVLRCTWDYTLRREEFLAWAGTVARLANPVDVVVWNSDKTYLGDLAEAGVPVVPTTSARPGEPVRTPDDGEFVVKPSVGPARAAPDDSGPKITRPRTPTRDRCTRPAVSCSCSPTSPPSTPRGRAR